jgi:hypothetical protein
VTSLMPVRARRRGSNLKFEADLFAFPVQIIQQLARDELRERTDVRVHWTSVGQFGTILGSIQRVNRG